MKIIKEVALIILNKDVISSMSRLIKLPKWHDLNEKEKQDLLERKTNTRTAFLIEDLLTHIKRVWPFEDVLEWEVKLQAMDLDQLEAFYQTCLNDSHYKRQTSIVCNRSKLLDNLPIVVPK